MKRLISTLSLILLIVFNVSQPKISLADEDVVVEVEVISGVGSPKISVEFTSPVGKKSDAAPISVSISGFEPSRSVFFLVQPIADAVFRADTDKNGYLATKFELPYGIEPGRHEIVARTSFGDDDTPAEYTLGEIYVNNAGYLTRADGSYPKGTRPAQIVPPNSAESFRDAPFYPEPVGTLRISDPQLRVSQGLLPTITAGLTFENATEMPASFAARITLTGPFGMVIGKPYFVNLDALAPAESLTVLANFTKLPPVGFFSIRTELILPPDFVAEFPVATSQSAPIFVPATFVWAFSALFVALLACLPLLRKSLMKRALIEK